MESRKRLLFLVAKHIPIRELIKQNQTKLDALCTYDIANTEDEYQQLKDKFNYDCMCVLHGNLGPKVLQENVLQQSKLRWVHSLFAGVDAYVKNKEFRDAEHIFLTNAKGAFSESLAEFVMLGVLYHTKKVEKFIQRKFEKKWEQEVIEMADQKVIGIIGFGDIGTHCAKALKNGLNMKVLAMKRNPKKVTEEQKKYVDEILGEDQLDYLLSKSDFVVDILPLTAETKDKFNYEFFKKMKPQARTKVVEQDLAKALKEKLIAGAVLDVFYEEPLSPDSELWSIPNVLMTPHCADLTPDYYERSMNIFMKNLESFVKDGHLINICNKQGGY